MEYVEGLTLARLVQEQGPLPVGLACAYVQQAALGLQHAFEHGMVHRDIKPQNLMVTKGKVKICDLGLSKDVRNDIDVTMTGQINCSPAYASPEQGRGLKDLDCRTDIYSLGVTLFEMLVGDVPFTGEGPADIILKHAMEGRPDPRAKNPGITPWAGALTLKMMAIKPEDRPAPGTVVQGIAEHFERR
jgi:serine/threonine protein kinase